MQGLKHDKYLKVQVLDRLFSNRYDVPVPGCFKH